MTLTNVFVSVGVSTLAALFILWPEERVSEACESYGTLNNVEVQGGIDYCWVRIDENVWLDIDGHQSIVKARASR